MNSRHHQRDDSPDGTHSGYFVIADISGYTGFLAGNELAHAHGILAEISKLLIEKLSAPFRFVELEGDAVFVFAPEVAVEDSERLVDIIEACYAAFRIRLDQMASNTSCEWMRHASRIGRHPTVEQASAGRAIATMAAIG